METLWYDMNLKVFLMLFVQNMVCTKIGLLWWDLAMLRFGMIDNLVVNIVMLRWWMVFDLDELEVIGDSSLESIVYVCIL